MTIDSSSEVKTPLEQLEGLLRNREDFPEGNRVMDQARTGLWELTGVVADGATDIIIDGNIELVYADIAHAISQSDTLSSDIRARVSPIIRAAMDAASERRLRIESENTLLLQ